MEYKEYCGFLYGYDKDKGYSILPNNKIERPSTFYKYYALSKTSVEALTNMYVYATHPYQFNDPFDCNEKLVEFDSWDDVRNLMGEKFDEIHNLYSNLEDACSFSKKAYWNLLYRKLGIISLATVADNYQMWSLYSENNGFCIEFDVEKFPFKHFGPFPMNYTECVPGAIHIGNEGGFVAMLIQSNIKNIWWKYENEWRLYVPNPVGLVLKYFGKEREMKDFNFGDEHDRKFRYPLAAIKSIILGPKFFDNLIANTIGSYEMDVSCPSNKELLELELMEFLAKIAEKSNILVFIANLNNFSSFRFTQIRIIRYSEKNYRIIYES